MGKPESHLGLDVTSDPAARPNEDLVAGPIPAGTHVDVRNRFDGSWSKGFKVAESDSHGYLIQRISDNSLLPDRFSRDEVRRPRRRQGFWWY